MLQSMGSQRVRQDLEIKQVDTMLSRETQIWQYASQGQYTEGNTGYKSAGF